MRIFIISILFVFTGCGFIDDGLFLEDDEYEEKIDSESIDLDAMSIYGRSGYGRGGGGSYSYGSYGRRGFRRAGNQSVVVAGQNIPKVIIGSETDNAETESPKKVTQYSNENHQLYKRYR